uniref:Uncharacterized protein n=1 Tax=Caenorhabditis tropicalis TaxID=1561998 RepID=A0A1I7T1X2_9PELO
MFKGGEIRSDKRDQQLLRKRLYRHLNRKIYYHYSSRESPLKCPFVLLSLSFRLLFNRHLTGERDDGAKKEEEEESLYDRNNISSEGIRGASRCPRRQQSQGRRRMEDDDDAPHEEEQSQVLTKVNEFKKLWNSEEEEEDESNLD